MSDSDITFLMMAFGWLLLAVALTGLILGINLVIWTITGRDYLSAFFNKIGIK